MSAAHTKICAQLFDLPPDSGNCVQLQTVPYLMDNPELGYVQTRWVFANPEESYLTKVGLHCVSWGLAIGLLCVLAASPLLCSCSLVASCALHKLGSFAWELMELAVAEQRTSAAGA